MDDDPYFGSPITNVVTGSTAYTSLNRYPADTLLYWRVRANDETGVGLAWSDVASFSALPPETYIDSGPLMTGSTAAFSFASNLPDASFKCRLDGPGARLGIPAACTSPVSYASLADGTYRFAVAAADLAGNADPTPATRTFTVDTTPPGTSISSAPRSTSGSRTPSFSFTATEAGSTFECRLDGPGAATGAWSTCSSPTQYAGVEDGAYTFSVRATDAFGNTDQTPASSRFSVDTQAPDTLISSGPGASTVAAGATFGFSATEAGSSFDCRLDGPNRSGGWARCSSPSSYTDLAAGAYTFSVRAVDAAGNTDGTPGTWTFVLTAPPSQDVPAPVAPVDVSSPAGPSASPPPVAPRLGTLGFLAPSRPLRARRGTVRLRFGCVDPDGCAAARFVLSGPARARRPGFTIGVDVRGAEPGVQVVAVKLSRAARRTLERARRRTIAVSLRRGRTGPATSFRLVARGWSVR